MLIVRGDLRVRSRGFAAVLHGGARHFRKPVIRLHHRLHHRHPPLLLRQPQRLYKHATAGVSAEAGVIPAVMGATMQPVQFRVFVHGQTRRVTPTQATGLMYAGAHRPKVRPDTRQRSIARTEEEPGPTRLAMKTHTPHLPVLIPAAVQQEQVSPDILQPAQISQPLIAEHIQILRVITTRAVLTDKIKLHSSVCRQIRVRSG